MERGLKVLLSPNEEVSFRHYEGGTFAGPRRVAYLIHLCLVDEKEGRLHGNRRKRRHRIT